MRVAVSSSHLVSATPSSSGGGLLTSFPCSSVGSLPWETVPHEVLQCEYFPWATVLHELLQCGSSTESQVLPANLLQCGLLSFHGFAGPARSLLQLRLSMGSQPRSDIHLLQFGCSTGCRWRSAPLLTSMGCSGQPASP